MEKVQVEILGLSSNPSAGGAFALLLRESYGNRRLPIIIGQFEAQAIALELEGIKPPRPLTHDLIKNLIRNLGANVTGVVIDELRDNTFYAKVNVEVATLKYDIDSRPSDAIAVAVRVGAPIYVADSVMNLAAFIPSAEDIDEEKAGETEAQEKHEEDQIAEYKNIPRETKAAALQDQLREAIEKEDYERAAKLRDEIKKITQNPN